MAENDIALMAHLMRRAAFGASYEELEARAAKGYEATVAMLNCVENDPCEAWPDGPGKLAAYARIADDNELQRLIRRIEKRRAVWKAEASQQPTNDR